MWSRWSVCQIGERESVHTTPPDQPLTHPGQASDYGYGPEDRSSLFHILLVADMKVEQCGRRVKELFLGFMHRSARPMCENIHPIDASR